MRLRLAGIGLATLLALPASAQQLESRLAAVRDGTIRLSFATRSEVCGDGRFIGIDTPRGFRMYTFHGNGSSVSGYSSEVLQDVQPECSTGPMRLVVEKANGRVTDLRAAVGVAWRPAAGRVTDLGAVSAPAVTAWILDNIAGLPANRFAMAGVLNSDVLAVAFVAAMSADSARVADRLLGIARTRTLTPAARAQALRWLTDVAAREGKPAAADDALRATVRDDTDDATVRDRAVRELDRTPANDAFLRETYRVVSPATLRDRIIRRVAESDSPENIAWLRGLVLDTRETRPLRDRALRALGEEMHLRAEIEALYPRLEDSELKVRALRLFAEAGDAGGLTRLRSIALADNESVEVRDRVIRLLAERRDFDFLQQNYGRLLLNSLKDRVIRSLAEGKGSEARAWLLGIAANEQETAELRDRAMRALAERGAPSADIAGLYDKVGSTSLRQRVVRLLVERGDDAAVDKLTLIADKDPDPEMRRFVLRRLGESKNPRARAYLERRI